jgi:hypothetical protein
LEGAGETAGGCEAGATGRRKGGSVGAEQSERWGSAGGRGRGRRRKCAARGRRAARKSARNKPKRDFGLRAAYAVASSSSSEDSARALAGDRSQASRWSREYWYSAGSARYTSCEKGGREGGREGRRGCEGGGQQRGEGREGGSFLSGQVGAAFFAVCFLRPTLLRLGLWGAGGGHLSDFFPLRLRNRARGVQG